MPGAWPVEIVALRPVNCGAFVWSFANNYCLTVVLKATFGLVPGGEARLVAPVPLEPLDRHRDDEPRRGVIAPSDLAPYIPKPSVAFIGHACAKHGQPEPWLRAQLSVSNGSRGMEKAIDVVGDFQAGKPQPFQRMPITWERAVRGGWNEAGIAEEAHDRNPNLVHPSDANVPAGFAPIPAAWAIRKRMLTASIEHVGEVLALPKLHWDYFQPTTPDQHLERIDGSETIRLEHLTASLPIIKTTLPGVRGVARLYGGDAPPSGTPIDLRADTLLIDGDQQRCSILWRGCVSIEGDLAELASLRLVTGIEMPGFPMPWEQAPPMVRLAPDAAGEDEILDEPTPFLDVERRPGAAPRPPMPEPAGPVSSKGGGSTIAFNPEEAARLIANAGQRMPPPDFGKPARPAGQPQAPPVMPAPGGASPGRASPARPANGPSSPMPPPAARFPEPRQYGEPDIGEDDTYIAQVEKNPKTEPAPPRPRTAPQAATGGGRHFAPPRPAAGRPPSPPPPAPPAAGAHAPSDTGPPPGVGNTCAISPEEAARLLANAPRPGAPPAPPPPPPAPPPPPEIAQPARPAPIRPPGQPSFAAPVPAPPPPAAQFAGGAAAPASPAPFQHMEREAPDSEAPGTQALSPEEAAALLRNRPAIPFGGGPDGSGHKK